MEMTVTRAIGERELLQKRIADIQWYKFVVAYKESADKVDGYQTPTQFDNGAIAKWQSLEDLEKRYLNICAAIHASNAVTMVTIAGLPMTVAEALARKEFLGTKKTSGLIDSILNSLELQYRQAQSELNNQNARVETALNTVLTNTLGTKEQRASLPAETIANVTVPYLKLNGWVIRDPIGLGNKLAKKREFVDAFKSEVDIALSESNSITKITIPD